MSLIDPDATIKLPRVRGGLSRAHVIVPSAPMPEEITSRLAQRDDAKREQTKLLQTSGIQKQEQQQQKIQEAQAQKPDSQKIWTKQVVRSIFRRRVPVLHQISMVECGAACLAMILTYYGRKTSVSEVRERCGVGRDGLSAFGIVKAARSYGLRTRAISLKENDFRFVPLPAIIHWNFKHFLIVERS